MSEDERVNPNIPLSRPIKSFEFYPSVSLSSSDWYGRSSRLQSTSVCMAYRIEYDDGEKVE
jgi:hypothetical protein